MKKKKLLFCTLLGVGFLLATSESATFLPNFIGLAMMFVAATMHNPYAESKRV